MMKSENEIPKYDLAEQIMAGQRKFAARKRIAPRTRIQRHKKVDTKPLITSYSPQNTEPEIQKSPKAEVLNFMSEKSPDQIISEIVARDIQNLRKR